MPILEVGRYYKSGDSVFKVLVVKDKGVIDCFLFTSTQRHYVQDIHIKSFRPFSLIEDPSLFKALYE